MNNQSMKLQLMALEYMENTYGKDWEKKNISQASIINSYIDGYRKKESEDKTAVELSVSKKTAQLVSENVDNLFQSTENEFPLIGVLLGIKVVGRDYMPDHLGALVDSDGKVLSFIEIKK